MNEKIKSYFLLATDLKEISQNDAAITGNMVFSKQQQLSIVNESMNPAKWLCCERSRSQTCRQLCYRVNNTKMNSFMFLKYKKLLKTDKHAQNVLDRAWATSGQTIGNTLLLFVRMHPRRTACVSVWRMLRVSCASLAVAPAAKASRTVVRVLSHSAGTSLITLMEWRDMHLSTSTTTTFETAAVRQIRRRPKRFNDGFTRTSCTTRTLYRCPFEISPAVSLICGEFLPVRCTTNLVCQQVSTAPISVGEGKD